MKKILLTILLTGAIFISADAQTFIDVGDVAPDFELVSLEGDTIRLSEFRGNPVLLNFFGYNCGPCILEAPLIEQTWNIYKDDGLVVLGINLWTTGQTIENVLNFYVNPTGTSYPVLLSGDVVGAAYGANVEDYFVIDQDGVVVLRTHGYHVGNIHGAIDDLILTSGIEERTGEQPERFRLRQNYPNPFNPETTIQFDLDSTAPVSVKIRIFNILGVVVNTLVDQKLAAGSYRVKWDSSDQQGRSVTSGIYYYQLQAGDRVAVKKMTLIR